MQVGKELRKARIEAGLSQEKLAQLANIHRVYLSELERDIKAPSLAVLVRLCEAMGMRTSEFLARVERD